MIEHSSKILASEEKPPPPPCYCLLKYTERACRRNLPAEEHSRMKAKISYAGRYRTSSEQVTTKRSRTETETSNLEDRTSSGQVVEERSRTETKISDAGRYRTSSGQITTEHSRMKTNISKAGRLYII